MRQLFPWMFRYDALFRQGFARVFEKVCNLVLVPVFGVSLSLSKISRKSNSIRRKLFGSATTIDTGRGFSVLVPLPSEGDLATYYSSMYWESRGLESPVVRVRDVVHFNLVDKTIPQLISAGKTFMNFGAGHGGLSILMAQKGVTVVNVEPNGLVDLYEEKWSTVQTISEVGDQSIDLCYGSHSLEHVADIDSVISHLERVLKPPGWVFWEVPNAASAEVGTGVRVPHTYYFTEDFFRSWLEHIEIIEFASRPLTVAESEKVKSSEGDSIRVIGHLGLRA